MNIIKYNKKGITLTELIVSSIMIAIVMVAVAAFSVAIKQMQQTTGRLAPMTMRMAGAIEHIKRNAYIAQGYKNNPGVRTDFTEEANGGPDCPLYFAFRQEDPLTDPPTPGDYSDDLWVIYTDGDDDCVGALPQMYSCVQLESNYTNGDFTDCYGGGGPPGPCAFVPDFTDDNPCDAIQADEDDNPIRLLDNIVGINYEFDPDGEAPNFYFDIEITIRYDATVLEDTLNNPEHTSHQLISPIAHTW